jgi:ribonuclease HI
MCDNLLWNGVEVEVMWIQYHVGLGGNELVDKRARHAALNGAVFDRPLPLGDLQGLALSVLLRE